MIHIFTLSTGVYNQFLKYQYATFHNLLPGRDKSFNLISDISDDIPDDMECTSQEYYHIANLPYPLVTLNKYTYICDMCNLLDYSDDDIIMYFDADTIYIQQPDDIWETYICEARKYVCFPYSPWAIKNKYIEDLENDVESVTHYDLCDEFKFKRTQTSFMMSTVKNLKIFMNDYNNLLAKDIIKNRRIPKMQDQAIVNRLLYDYFIEKKLMEIEYLVKGYIYNYYFTDNSFLEGEPQAEYNFKKIPTCCKRLICMQKFNDSIKKAKRNSTEFSVNI